MKIRRTVLVFICATFLFQINSSRVFAYSVKETNKAKKAIFMLSISIKEYTHGVKEKKIINRDEYNDAKNLLKNSFDLIEGFRMIIPESHKKLFHKTITHFGNALKDIESLISIETLNLAYTEISKNIITLFDITIDFTPPSPPSVRNGKKLYKNHCSSCHGKKGQGNGIFMKLKKKTLRSFENMELRAESFESYQIIFAGVTGSLMPEYSEKLDEKEMWDIVYYIRTFKKESPPIIW